MLQGSSKVMVYDILVVYKKNFEEVHDLALKKMIESLKDLEDNLGIKSQYKARERVEKEQGQKLKKNIEQLKILEDTKKELELSNKQKEEQIKSINEDKEKEINQAVKTAVDTKVKNSLIVNLSTTCNLFSSITSLSVVQPICLVFLVIVTPIPDAFTVDCVNTFSYSMS